MRWVAVLLTLVGLMPVDVAAVASAGEYLLLQQTGSTYNITHVNQSTGFATGTVTTNAIGGSYTGLGVRSNGDYVLLNAAGGGTYDITFIDRFTGTSTGGLTTNAIGTGYTRLGVRDDGSYVLVKENPATDYSITFIDPATGIASGSITTAVLGSGYTGLGINAVGEYVLFQAIGSNYTVKTIDPVTGVTTSTVGTTTSIGYTGMAVEDNGEYLLLQPVSGAYNITFMDPNTGTLTGTITTNAIGTGYTALGIEPEPPAISSISPASGKVGDTITISGDDFDPTPGNNIVYFGTTRATVSTATTTSLDVVVPDGGILAPISVQVDSLTGYSDGFFVPTFPGLVQAVGPTTFGPRVDFASGPGLQYVIAGDFDQDGKPDLAVSENGGVSVYPNTSSGTIDAGSLGAPFSIATGPNVEQLAAGDLDGDGRLDIVVSNQGSNNFTALRNTSPIGGPLSFTASGSFSADNSPRGIGIADFNGDGRPDVAVANQGADRISVHGNTGAPGSIAFASPVFLNSGGQPFGLEVSDMDGDGLTDIVVANFTSSTFSVFRNTGGLSFSRSDFSAQSGASGLRLADLDNDGDRDVVIPGYFSHVSTVAINSSVPGSLAFANLPDLNSPGGSNPIQAVVGDMDGDGLVDIAVTHDSAPVLAVYKNNGSGFNSRVEFTTGLGPRGVTAVDVNADGRSDLVVTTQSSLTIELFQHQELTLSIPDTTVARADTVLVPINISGVDGNGIVSIEIKVTYDNTVATPTAPFFTEVTGTLMGDPDWSVEENVLPGVGTIDTISLAMSTGVDTLSGQGALIDLMMVAKDIRSPSPGTTPLSFAFLQFNAGNPLSQNVDGSLTVTGTDGTVDAAPDSVNPGQPVTITVTDVDEDRTAAADVFSVLAFDKTYADSEFVVVTETGGNTGVFTGTLPTVFEGVSATKFDGTMQVIAPDSIVAEYTDSLSSAGTVVTRRDTVEVVGGEDGLLDITYVAQSLDGRNGVRDTIRLQVTDGDLDVTGTPDQVSVTISNLISSESELVQLTETGASTGIFRAKLPTLEGVGGTDDDGVMEIDRVDSLEAVYSDALTAIGSTATRRDSTRIINLFGDIQSNDRVGAFDAAFILATAVGATTTNATDSLIMDVTGDGLVIAMDASFVLQYVVQLIDRFPVQTDTVMTSDPKNHPFLKPVSLDRIIALGEMVPQGDGTVLAPVQLYEREGIVSGTLTIGQSEGVSVIDAVAGDGYDGFMVVHNDEGTHTRVAFAGTAAGQSGPGDVIWLRLKPETDAPIRLTLDSVALNGRTFTTDVAPESHQAAVDRVTTPFSYALHQNVPNPFNPQTTIRYDVPDASHVRVVLYSLTGQEVRELVSEEVTAGTHQVVWDGRDAHGLSVATGVYILRMSAGGFESSRKILLLK